MALTCVRVLGAGEKWYNDGRDAPIRHRRVDAVVQLGRDVHGLGPLRARGGSGLVTMSFAVAADARGSEEVEDCAW